MPFLETLTPKSYDRQGGAVCFEDAKQSEVDQIEAIPYWAGVLVEKSLSVSVQAGHNGVDGQTFFHQIICQEWASYLVLHGGGDFALAVIHHLGKNTHLCLEKIRIIFGPSFSESAHLPGYSSSPAHWNKLVCWYMVMIPGAVTMILRNIWERKGKLPRHIPNQGDISELSKIKTI